MCLVSFKNYWKSFLFIFWLISTAQSQTLTNISGYVFDSRSNFPVAGARLELSGTNYKAFTDPSGFFFFENLPEGEYVLEAHASGYRVFLLEKVRVQQASALKLDIQLEPLKFELAPIQVIAEREQKNINPFFSAEIVNKEKIANSRATGLVELLEELPGLYIRKTGSSSDLSKISIRGSSSEQVLILLNGERLNSVASSEVDLNSVPISQVEKIEIIKQGASALYGPDALGGVINIVTTKPGHSSVPKQVQDKFNLKGYAASFQTFASELSWQQSFNHRLFLNLWGSKYHSGGNFKYYDSDGTKNTRENTGKDRDNFYLQSSYNISTEQTLVFSLQTYTSEIGIPGPLLQLTPFAKLKDKRTLSQLNWSREQKKYQLEIQLSYNRWEDIYTDSSNVTYFPSQTTIPYHNSYLDRQFSWQNKFSFTPTSTVTVQSGTLWQRNFFTGKDYIRENLSLGEIRRDLKSIFLSYQQDFDFLKNQIFFSPAWNWAIRYDRTSGLGDEISPFVGLSFTRIQNYSLTLRADYGKAYHNPNLNSLFWKEDAFAVGNLNLKPEKSESFNAGFEVSYPVWGKLELKFEYFHNFVRDLISWQRRFDGKFTPLNISKSEISGQELGLVWESPKKLLKIHFNHTITEALNKSGEYPVDRKYLVFRPRHSRNFRLDFSPSGWLTGYFKIHYVSKRYTRAENTEFKFLKPYTILDAGLFVRKKLLSSVVSLGIELENLTRESYELIERYPMPLRSWRTTLNIEF